MPMPGSGVNVAVILDASASMQMADGSGQPRYARAVAAAERDMDRLPWGASVTVVLAGDEARVAADHVRLNVIDALFGQNLHACRNERLGQPQPAVIGRYIQADQLGGLPVAGDRGGER